MFTSQTIEQSVLLLDAVNISPNPICDVIKGMVRLFGSVRDNSLCHVFAPPIDLLAD